MSHLFTADSCSSINGDLMSDEDSYSASYSSVDSITTPEHARAVVDAHVNGHPPPLPPRKPIRSVLISKLLG